MIRTIQGKLKLITIVFKEGNGISYGQDFQMHKGVPPHITFTVAGNMLMGKRLLLIAPGYGDKKHYGDGPIYVNVSDLRKL